LVDGLERKNLTGLPVEMIRAAEDARLALAGHDGPQRADILIDKAVLAAMYRTVHEYNNAFFRAVVRGRIDIENIRSLVRVKRAGRDVKHLAGALHHGGTIPCEKWMYVFRGGMRDVAAFLELTKYAALAPVIDRLTFFEKECDNAMLAFIGEANRVVFGVEPILGYILEKENEITSLRMVMASKMANIPAQTIIERLREYAQ
jgi:V/A-type H+-transporting ATPase subunit C